MNEVGQADVIEVDEDQDGDTEDLYAESNETGVRTVGDHDQQDQLSVEYEGKLNNGEKP